MCGHQQSVNELVDTLQPTQRCRVYMVILDLREDMNRMKAVLESYILVQVSWSS